MVLNGYMGVKSLKNHFLFFELDTLDVKSVEKKNSKIEKGLRNNLIQEIFFSDELTFLG